MTGLWGAVLRRVRLRRVAEAIVQTVRAESQPVARDGVERWQDYGFAAHPGGDGEGLVLEVGGHTIVLRMDRLADRPALDPLEVSIWHAEGHQVVLRAGQLVEVTCKDLRVIASGSITLDAPTVSATGAVDVGTTLSAGASVSAPQMSAANGLSVGGVQMGGHTHGGVRGGSDTSGPAQ